MITLDNRSQLIESLQDKEYRRAFADENVGVGLAFQISLMREDRGWTQDELARRSGKAQESISQLENPNYGKFTLSTLKKLARAFDVALLVRFVPFGDLAEWTVDLNSKRLTPPSYEEERQLSFYHHAGSPEWKLQAGMTSTFHVDIESTLEAVPSRDRGLVPFSVTAQPIGLSGTAFDTIVIRGKETELANAAD